MKARFVNESIKHLVPRSQEDIIFSVENEDPYTRLYIGLKYNIEKLVRVALNQHSVTGSGDDDPLYVIGTLYLENEEISFRYTGTWAFDKEGKIYCKTWDGEVDSECEESLDFIEKHGIRYNLIRRGAFTNYVEFSGNIRDIIKFITKYLLGGYLYNPRYIIEQISDIIAG